MTKSELRAWAKQQRDQLDIPAISPRVCQHLAGFLSGRGIKHILSYSAFGSEIDLSQLQTLYPINYYLPRVEQNHLYIHPLPTELVRHKYGMLEPSAASSTVDAGVLEAILVPGLTFDQKGYRLGYGKGFYDRFLSDLKPEILTIGIAVEALIIESMPKDIWDIPVAYLASESEIKKVLKP